LMKRTSVLLPAVAEISSVRRMTGSGAELRRTLGTGDAVVIGLGAMLGAGVYAVWSPAAAVAGSWLLLGEILTTLELPHDEPATDRCGTCRRCLDACPTGAIVAPYQLDARKCISYLTIEHRGEIGAELQAQMGDWLYGCDVCQDVCPWNSKAVESLDPALRPRFPSGTLDAREVAEWDEEGYRAALRHSAMKRVKLPQLARNARIVLNNSQGG